MAPQGTSWQRWTTTSRTTFTGELTPRADQPQPKQSSKTRTNSSIYWQERTSWESTAHAAHASPTVSDRAAPLVTSATRTQSNFKFGDDYSPVSSEARSHFVPPLILPGAQPLALTSAATSTRSNFELGCRKEVPASDTYRTTTTQAFPDPQVASQERIKIDAYAGRRHNFVLGQEQPDYQTSARLSHPAPRALIDSSTSSSSPTMAVSAAATTMPAHHSLSTAARAASEVHMVMGRHEIAPQERWLTTARATYTGAPAQKMEVRYNRATRGRSGIVFGFD